MKKNFFLVLSLVAGLMFVSCKTQESDYKKAYEKAKAQELEAQQTTEPVAVTPVVTPVETPAEETNVRSERLNVMNGGVLKAYNVVCGSFKSVDNANNLRNTLVNQGYSAQDPDTGMYRVVAFSSDDKSEAVSSRDNLRSTYPDAWLLYRTY